MKILLITDNHAPIGGAENYFFDLKARLKKVRDLEVFSLGFGQREVLADDYYILKVSKSKLTKLTGRFLIHPLLYRKLCKKLTQINPDIIHIHNIKQHSATLLKALQPYKVVQTVHDYSFICPTAQNIHRDRLPCTTGLRKNCLWDHQIKYRKATYLALLLAFFKMRKAVRRQVKHFFAPSPLLAQYLQKNGFKDTIYVPPFIPDKKPAAFEAINPNQFFYAGHLGSHKGTDILLEEFALACRNQPNLRLLIAGADTGEKEVSKKILQLKLSNQIKLLGWKKDLTNYYRESIATIFPSVGLESFGLVMSEAMSHARPLLAAKRGTCAWLVDDKETGLLFDPLKHGDLATKILLIANNPELAKILGKAAQKKLFSMIDNKNSLQQIIDTYKLLIQE